MRLDLKTGILSLTEFARNTKEQTQQVIENGTPKVLTQNGKVALVVMSVEQFEQLSHEAEEHRMNMRLRDAMESYAAGDHGEKMETVMERIRQRHQL